MNAQEAKERTEKAIAAKKDYWINCVFEEINYAASNGEYSRRIHPFDYCDYNNLTVVRLNNIIQQLEQLGYTIVEGCDSCVYLNISWK